MLIGGLNHDYSKQISNTEPESEPVDRYWLIPCARVLEIFAQPDYDTKSYVNNKQYENYV